MRDIVVGQDMLLPGVATRFPSTRYQGSKAKLANWIWSLIADLEFTTCLDAFGGTGAIAYKLKQEGKAVTYNDILRFNYYIGLALIENSHTRLSAEDLNWLMSRHAAIRYPSFVYDTFRDIYFTDAENQWIDQMVANIQELTDPLKRALAFFALFQACIIKRPYNLFHRKNLYVRFAEVRRSFGNKTSWDRPFEEWFLIFATEANQAIFDNNRANKALNLNAVEVSEDFDLVYIDTPYLAKTGVGVDYLDFYHFLEGLTRYNEWDRYIDRGSKHLRFIPHPSEWTNRKTILGGFDKLFHRFRRSIIVVSYRSDGIPSEQEITALLRAYKGNVQQARYGQYKYVLSHNSESAEILLVGS